MLSEKVLEELTRNTALREQLVLLAWPSLAVESKLQVLDAVTQDASDSTPEWLTRLAIDDEAPLVRYWAAKHTYFKRKSLGNSDAASSFQREQLSMQTLALAAKADADKCDLVRLAASVDRGLFACAELTVVPQTQRLLTIRHWSSPSLSQFVEWLEAAVTAGVQDRELQECACEFFAHPQTKRDLKRKSLDFNDGYDAHLSGKGMEKGWALMQKCGPALMMSLVCSLPTSYGLGTMKVETLALLPERALDFLVYSFDPSPEVIALIKLMRTNPDRFPPEVIKNLGQNDENEGPCMSDQEVEVMRRSRSVTTAHETLAVALEIKHALGRMREEQQEQAAKPKRGFFG